MCCITTTPGGAKLRVNGLSRFDNGEAQFTTGINTVYIKDANASRGTAGQVLSSVASGLVQDVEWENNFNSKTTGEPTGSDVMVNIVSLTQAEYDAGTPVSTTLYIIT